MNAKARRRLPLLSSTFARITSTAGLSVLLQLYMAKLGANLLEIGGMSSLRGLFTIAFSPIWGALSDRYGRKKYLILSSLLSLCVMMFYPFSKSTLVILILVSAFAITNSGFNPIATALSSENSRRRGVEISFFNTSISIGNFTSKVLIGVVLIFISVERSLWLFIFIFAGSLIPLFFVKDVQRKGTSRRTTLLLNSGDVYLMKKYKIWSIYIGTFLRQFGVNGMLSVVAVYIVYFIGLSPFMVGFLASLNPLVQIFSIPFFAKVVERKKKSKHSILIGMAFSALSLFLFATWRGAVGIALAYTTLGFGYGAFISASTSYISFAVPSNLRGKFMGFFTSSRSVGVVTGSMTAGLVSEFFGYEIAFFLMCVLVLSAFFMVLFFFNERVEVFE